MDSERVFERYLRARIRADRMKNYLRSSRLSPESRLDNSNRGRLVAGGSRNIAETSPLPFSTCGQKDDQASCSALKQQETKPSKCLLKRKFKYHCKKPIITVRSKPRIGYKSMSHVHFDKPEEKSKKSRAVSPEDNENMGKPSTPEKVQKKPATYIYPAKDDKQQTSDLCSCCPGKSEKKPEWFGERNECSKPTPIVCTECEKIPHIAMEITSLNKKLADQLKDEINQKRKLNEMNEKLKELCGTVHSLNEKCKCIDAEKEEILKRCTCMEQLIEASNSRLERKPSSICEFCKDLNLPVLTSMYEQLLYIIGERHFTDVALTILLRADNVYHVNVRDLLTGGVLGCLLANDEGIREANYMGVFREILTFCVIDVRNTIKKKDNLSGVMNFELIRNRRLVGGSVDLQLKLADEKKEEQKKAESAPNKLQTNLQNPILRTIQTQTNKSRKSTQDTLQCVPTDTPNEPPQSSRPFSPTNGPTNTVKASQAKPFLPRKSRVSRNGSPTLSDSQAKLQSKKHILSDRATEQRLRSIPVLSFIQANSSDCEDRDINLAKFCRDF